MSGQDSRQTAFAHRPYFPELDGVRAVAALMVMVFHFSQTWYPKGFLVLGQTGVDLFFVLSGFLITTILFDSRRGDWREVRRFYARRVLRIFPLYYGYLALACVFSGAVSVWFWVYLQNWPLALQMPVIGPNHFWSLAVEEQFYLVWPFLILFWPRRSLASAMWGMVVLAVLARLVTAPFDFGVFYATVTRLDGLAAGGLLSLYFRRGSLAGRSGRTGLMALVFAGLLLLQWKVSHGQGAAWVQVTKFSFASGFYAASIGWLLSSRKNAVHHFLGSPGMRKIGQVSYGLYVFHPAVFAFLVPRLSGLPLLLRAAVSFAAVFVVALVSWYGVERHFVEMKERVAPEERIQAVPMLVKAERRLDAA